MDNIKTVYRICSRWIVMYKGGVMREYKGSILDIPKRVQFFCNYMSEKEMYKGVVIYERRQ